jgi:hypothetical protein
MRVKYIQSNNSLKIIEETRDFFRISNLDNIESIIYDMYMELSDLKKSKNEIQNELEEFEKFGSRLFRKDGSSIFKSRIWSLKRALSEIETNEELHEDTPKANYLIGIHIDQNLKDSWFEIFIWRDKKELRQKIIDDLKAHYSLSDFLDETGRFELGNILINTNNSDLTDFIFKFPFEDIFRSLEKDTKGYDC